MPLIVHPLTLSLAQAYLVETAQGLLLVDAGMAREEHVILRAMRRLGRTDLKLILITHAHGDHYGSAAALRQVTGALVAVHTSDAPAMASGRTQVRPRMRLLRAAMPLLQRFVSAPPVQADVLLSEGDTLDAFGLPGCVLHTPGHTPGSCCLVLPDRSAFVGDLVSTNRRPHLQRLFIDDWGQLRESYVRLRQEKLERVYAGHGRRVLTGEELRRVIDAELDSLDSGSLGLEE